jgi:tetratricopeptide (TPR) repeat protein
MKTTRRSTTAPTSTRSFRLVIISALLFCTHAVFAADNTNSSPTNRADDAVSQELRTYLQLQEQLHATQLAVERNRKESEEAAAQTATALNNRLQSLEQTLAATRSRELDVVQSSNRSMLYVAGSFAVMGFIAMLLVAYFQWRTVSRLAEISAALPIPLDRHRPLPALGPGEPEPTSTPILAQTNTNLMDTVERLEKRIHELEHNPAPVAAPVITAGNGEPEKAATNGIHPEPSLSAPSSEPSSVDVLLSRGQSLLNMDKAEEALACFDEALTLDPNHPEALVKRGTALERLRKLTEAIQCYDRAIEADASMTIAYLYKGGLFNRMERFSEALECYEKALRTQEKRAA